MAEITEDWAVEDVVEELRDVHGLTELQARGAVEWWTSHDITPGGYADFTVEVRENLAFQVAERIIDEGVIQR